MGPVRRRKAGQPKVVCDRKRRATVPSSYHTLDDLFYLDRTTPHHVTLRCCCLIMGGTPSPPPDRAIKQKEDQVLYHRAREYARKACNTQMVLWLGQHLCFPRGSTADILERTIAHIRGTTTPQQRNRVVIDYQRDYQKVLRRNGAFLKAGSSFEGAPAPAPAALTPALAPAAPAPAPAPAPASAPAPAPAPRITGVDAYAAIAAASDRWRASKIRIEQQRQELAHIEHQLAKAMDRVAMEQEFMQMIPGVCLPTIAISSSELADLLGAPAA